MIKDLWLLDASIPLKDQLLVELIRGAVLWVIWLERNDLIFNNSEIRPIQALAAKIIALTTFWCKNIGDSSYLKLTIILPNDVKDIPHSLGPREIPEDEAETIIEAEEIEELEEQ